MRIWAKRPRPSNWSSPLTPLRRHQATAEWMMREYDLMSARPSIRPIRRRKTTMSAKVPAMFTNEVASGIPHVP